ncbi:MAG TPA: DUF3006 domain-containing protein [Candidatus Scybalosoma faecavium]|nr:DUF3006 domain-containing protein [Candidatus Scybalosoma faecavium]
MLRLRCVVDWIIDRIQDEIASVEVEEGKVISIPVSALPEGSQEGDVLCIVRDEKKTAERRDRAAKKLRGLFQKRQ